MAHSLPNGNQEPLNWQEAPWDEARRHRLQAQAMAKFPEEWDRIVKKYGAVAWDTDPTGEIVLGLAEPDDYIQDMHQIFYIASF